MVRRRRAANSGASLTQVASTFSEVRSARRPVRATRATSVPTFGIRRGQVKDVPSCERDVPSRSPGLPSSSASRPRGTRTSRGTGRSRCRPTGPARFQRPLDRGFEWPPVNLMLHPRRKRHLSERPDEAPAFGCCFDVDDDVYLFRVATSETPLVGEANVLDRQWVEAHELSGDRVDGHRIGAGQQDVL